MTTASASYGTSTALTKTLASLASDTNLLVGRALTAIDNTSNLGLDCMLTFRFRTGTSPTASRQGELWAAPSEDGTIYAGDSGGSDAAKTHTADSKARLTPLDIAQTNNTSNTDYTIIIPSLCFALRCIILPRKVGLWFVHNTGVNLNSTEGNHVVTYSYFKAASA